MKTRGGAASTYYYPAAGGLLVAILLLASIGATVSPHIELTNDDIVLPGTPIESTVFSSIVSNSLDACAFNATWELISTEPYMMNMTLPENTIDVGEAQQTCREFFGSNLSSLLYYDGETIFPDIGRHLWGFSYRNNEIRGAFGAYIWINAITDKVCAYAEHSSTSWLEEHGLLNSSTVPVSMSTSDADTIALDFLQTHNYTLLPGSRHIRTQRVEYDPQEIFYEIQISTPVEGVFAGPYYSGISLRVDTFTSRVISFSYTYVHLPVIDISNIRLCSPVEARASASLSLGPGRVDWKGTYLIMFPATTMFDDTSKLQLAWGFEYLHPNGDTDEILVDAITGKASDLYQGIRPDTSDAGFGALVLSASCICLSVAISTASYFLILRYRRNQC